METNLHHIPILCFPAISRNLDRLVMSALGLISDTRTFEHVRELCESVLMGCDESWVSQRAPADSI